MGAVGAVRGGCERRREEIAGNFFFWFGWDMKWKRMERYRYLCGSTDCAGAARRGDQNVRLLRSGGDQTIRQADSEQTAARWFE